MEILDYKILRINFEQKDLNIQSRDEIGILAHSFESTRIRLKDYIEEITDKKVDVYLYSIMDEKFKHVL